MGSLLFPAIRRRLTFGLLEWAIYSNSRPSSRIVYNTSLVLFVDSPALVVNMAKVFDAAEGKISQVSIQAPIAHEFVL